MASFVCSLRDLALLAPRCLITEVAAEVAELELTEFVAVTLTRMVRPASALVSWYLLAVAPAIAMQAPPDASQRRHW